jgi:zinc transport system substrate-binding protein
MKKIKYLLLLLVIPLLFSGCTLFKMDTMEDISIVTTNYPLEFVTRYLYGKHSIIKSMYPDGTDISKYKITDAMIENFSKEDLFIYLGYGDDKDIAKKLINSRQNNLLLIDGSRGMSPDYESELWLNPNNLIMIAQNINYGLSQYITSNYLVKEIQDNFEELSVKLSELDAEYRLTCENAPSKTIVTSTKYLNFLKNYGFNVISLDDDNNAIEKTMNEVNELISNGTINYIYTLKDVEVGQNANTILENNTNVKKIELKKIDNISSEERNNGDDYFTMMNYNLEELKKETYN